MDVVRASLIALARAGAGAGIFTQEQNSVAFYHPDGMGRYIRTGYLRS